MFKLNDLCIFVQFEFSLGWIQVSLHWDLAGDHIHKVVTMPLILLMSWNKSKEVNQQILSLVDLVEYLHGYISPGLFQSEQLQLSC